jgi:hypothetical protein
MWQALPPASELDNVFGVRALDRLAQKIPFLLSTATTLSLRLGAFVRVTPVLFLLHHGSCRAFVLFRKPYMSFSQTEGHAAFHEKTKPPNENDPSA